VRVFDRIFWGFAVFFFSILGFSAQAQFSDDFSDGDFTAGVVWSGDDTIFEATNFDLHLNAAPITGEAYMATPSQAIEAATWEFLVQMDFNPSSSNLSRVYLVSDAQNLRGSLNGYFVEIGNSSDEVSLYRQDGTSDTELIDGADGTMSQSALLVRVRVTRDNVGNWELQQDSIGGANFVSEGTVFDDTYTQSYFSGVFCLYTSTRSDKFWFDDFVVTGNAFTDTIDPTLTSISVISDTELDVYFSEPLNQSSAENENNFTADNSIGNPTSALLDGGDPTLVHLTFTTAFGNGVTNTLTIVNVQDLASNSIGTASGPFIYFIPDVAVYRDVVINELFPDPTPAVGLPESEYVEIYNASNKLFDLNGWTLSDGSSTATLGTRALLPGQHLILVANADTAVFLNNVTANVMGVSSFPSLNNASDNITLTDDFGAIIDFVNYDDSWYQNDSKDGGGWSLEQINPELPCSNPSNWIASNDGDGGTPGAQNSVFNNTPDTQGPSLTDILVLAPDTILLLFDESLDSTSVTTATYTIDNGVGAAAVINVGPEYNSVIVVLTPLLTAGVVHTLTVTGISDCTGNTIAAGTDIFALPQQATTGDVLVNEVLFNPRTGGVDFVEIYNHSDKVLSIKDWKLANYDNDTIDNIKVMSEVPLLFFPGEYFVFTTNKSNILFEYPMGISDRILEVPSLPSYNNDSSTVYIINNLDSVSDSFSYDEDQQFGLLSETDGVSLERIDFDRPASESTNWHSAAASVGYATPGYENSQYYPTSVPDDAITIDPKVFSPDNDGFQDVVNISYVLDGPGYVGNVTIYDSRGRLIRHLVRSELLATSGTFSWDGIMESREKARIGMYIVFVEVFDLSGDVSTFKRTVVLGAQL